MMSATAGCAIVRLMAQPVPNHPTHLEPEASADSEARLAWERVRLAEAEEDFANGRYIEGDEAEAWLAKELADAQAMIDRQPD